LPASAGLDDEELSQLRRHPFDGQMDVNKARGDTPGQEDMTPPPKTISSNSSKLAAPKADAAAQAAAATRVQAVQRGYSARETAASIRGKGKGAASEAYHQKPALPASAGLDDEELSQLRRHPLDGQTDVSMALDATPCPSGEDMAHGRNSASKPKPTPRPSQREGKEIDSSAMRISQTRLQRSQIRKPSPKQSDGIQCTGSKFTATRNKSK